MRRWGQTRTGGCGRPTSRWDFLLRPGEPPQEVKPETTESGFHLQGTVLPAGGFQGGRGQVGGWGCLGSPEVPPKVGVRTRSSGQSWLDPSDMNSICCCQGRRRWRTQGCPWSSQAGWGEPMQPRDPKLTSLPEKRPASRLSSGLAGFPAPQVQMHTARRHTMAFPTQRGPPSHHHSNALSTRLPSLSPWRPDVWPGTVCVSVCV